MDQAYESFALFIIISIFLVGLLVALAAFAFSKEQKCYVFGC
jgi:hypothetical protein